MSGLFYCKGIKKLSVTSREAFGSKQVPTVPSELHRLHSKSPTRIILTHSNGVILLEQLVRLPHALCAFEQTNLSDQAKRERDSPKSSIILSDLAGA